MIRWLSILSIKYFIKESMFIILLVLMNSSHMDTVKHQETSLGGYISDESLSLEILDHLKNSEKPLFIHAVSMQNHIPYNQAAKENKIKTSSRHLTEQSTKVLEGYTEGVRRTDEALKLLVDELERLENQPFLYFGEITFRIWSTSIRNLVMMMRIQTLIQRNIQKRLFLFMLTLKLKKAI